MTPPSQESELLTAFSKATRGTTAQIKKLRQEALYANGSLPPKIKLLGAVLWSIAARCEPCIQFYVQEALKHGATEEELGECLSIALAMGGCVGETWALKAYRAFRSPDAKSSDESCCH